MIFAFGFGWLSYNVIYLLENKCNKRSLNSSSARIIVSISILRSAKRLLLCGAFAHKVASMETSFGNI
jgi:hypothetical protein